MRKQQITFGDIRAGDKLMLEGGYSTSEPVTALRLDRIPNDAGGPYTGQWAWYFIESAPLVGQRCFIGETNVFLVLPEDNLRDMVKMEIHHHISPLIGWLRHDAAKGKVDTDGTRYNQWKERAALAVDAIMEHVGEVEYEYNIVRTSREDGESYGVWFQKWGTLEHAEKDCRNLTQAEEDLEKETGFRYADYRIVKRRKAGGIEEL